MPKSKNKFTQSITRFIRSRLFNEEIHSFRSALVLTGITAILALLVTLFLPTLPLFLAFAIPAAVGVATLLISWGINLVSMTIKHFERKNAIATVQKNGLALEHLADKFRQDEEIVLTAITQNPRSLKFASNTLKNNAKIVSTAVEKDGMTLEFASTELQNNSDIVGKAIQYNGLALQFASASFKNNRHIVYKAITAPRWDPQRPYEIDLNYGEALQFASDDLKNDDRMVFKAIKLNPAAFQYGSNEIRSNTKLITNLVKGTPFSTSEFPIPHPHFFQYVSPKLRDNKNFVKEILDIANIFPYLSDELTNDQEIILWAVKRHNPDLLARVSLDLRNNKTLMRQVLAQDSRALQYASSNVQEDLALHSFNKDINLFTEISKSRQPIKLQFQFAAIVIFILKTSFPEIKILLENRVLNRPTNNCTIEDYLNECAYLIKIKTSLPNSLLQGLQKNLQQNLGIFFKNPDLGFSSATIKSRIVQSINNPLLSTKTINQLNQFLTPIILDNQAKQALIQMISDHCPKKGFFKSFLRNLDEKFPEIRDETPSFAQ